MDYLEGVAKKMGIHVLIGTLSKDNQASIKLSGKMKYEKVAHVKNVGGKFGTVLGCCYVSKRNIIVPYVCFLNQKRKLMKIFSSTNKKYVSKVLIHS